MDPATLDELDTAPAGRPVAVDTVSGDYSSSFHLVRAGLTDSQGTRYLDFLRTLEPDFGRVRRDLAIGYILLIASAGVAVAMARAGAPFLLTVPVGAVLIGYWIAYILLFIHEAAHYNLSPSRERNDRLCNWLVSWFIGTTAAQYRIVHFQHHRALGTVDDSEITYFSPLDPGFIFKTLFGVRSLEVILRRRKLVAGGKAQVEQAAKNANSSAERRVMLICGVAAHGAIVFGLWLAGGFAPALAWIVGVGMVFPFFGALRQLLEHRAEEAQSAVDYTTTDHGAFTRMFGTGAFSSTFGGAGFNRHLLHHWEPKVSYTNFLALEGFLLDTKLGPVVEARRSSYVATFVKLMASSSPKPASSKTSDYKAS
jgi:fatty acid desaturase